MVSFKLYIIVKLMTLWNNIKSKWLNIKCTLTNIKQYVNDYLDGYHDTWFFIPDHTLPLAISNLNNMVDIEWLYDNNQTILSLYSADNKRVPCKLSWLSAKLSIIPQDNPDVCIQYDIDDFIEKFVVVTYIDHSPSLYMIFLCWCIYKKHWFNLNDHIEFQIIDDMGEEISINLLEYYNYNIKEQKIYITIDTCIENNTSDAIIDLSDNINITKNKDD